MAHLLLVEIQAMKTRPKNPGLPQLLLVNDRSKCPQASFLTVIQPLTLKYITINHYNHVNDTNAACGDPSCEEETRKSRVTTIVARQ